MTVLTRFSRFLERITSARRLAALLLVLPALPLWIMPATGPGQVEFLDLRLSYSPEEVHRLLESLGAEGRAAYARMALTSDLIFPLLYSLALSMAFTLLSGSLFPGESRLQHLRLLPLAALLADVAENLAIAGLIYSFPELPVTLVRWASTFTGLKWASVVLNLGLLLALAGIRLARHRP